ncbi:MAG TPA: vWA domain-containing protein [Streptosporangiaceae bacterium]|nr:vWA domain-containing protein [Streptosporangiaceae bacterium]
MTETLMPGGGVARRPLHFIVMADCSGSMKGEKMQALNYALRSMLPHLVDWERDQLQAQLLIRILSFASAPNWYVPEPVPVADLSRHWRNLEYVPMGRTNMGPAFRAVADVLTPERLERRALRPAILLVTDGLPTDPPGGFENGLAALLDLAAGRSALRLAVAIGRDANSEPLDRFRSPEVPVLVADGTDEIADRLVTASIAVSRMSEIGADRAALAVQLIKGGASSSEPGYRPGAGAPPAAGGYEDIL